MLRALRGSFFVVAILGWLTGIPIRGQTNQLTGHYSGTVHNSTSQSSAGVEIGVNQEMETIYGCMGVNLPLFGSGPLHGKIEGRDVSFDVVSPTMTIQFHGQRDGDSIAGTYIVSPSEDGMKQQGEFSLRRDTLESLPIGFNLQDCPDDAAVHREGTLFVQKLGRTKATGTPPARLRSAPQAEGPSVTRGTQLEPNKPLTQDQVQRLVGAGLGDETGAKAIEQRGIDFAPAEEFLQSLKAAGANEAFLQALRAAKRPEPANPKKPINQVQVFALLASGVSNYRVTMLVGERGIDFEPTDDYLKEVRLAGGEEELITGLKGAKVTKPAIVDPAAQTRQAQVQQHVAHGAELEKNGQHAQAEQEYRAALLFDPHNEALYDSLAYVLAGQERWDDAASAAREALRLNPNDDTAHNNLGLALGSKGDVDGAIAEYREALRLNANDDTSHYNLGGALGRNGDMEGAESEFREALRLNPRLDQAHAALGAVLELKGDHNGARSEYHTAYLLDPKNPIYKQAYEQGTMSGLETEKYPANSRNKELPATEVAKLNGTCEISAVNLLWCQIYNGSNWTVEEITVLITVKERDKKKGEKVVFSRQYNADAGHLVKPASSSPFADYLGFSLVKHQQWEWKIVSARGLPTSD